MDKPIAILGDGPSLDDLVDEDQLMEERFVIAVQGAVFRKKCHVAFLGDPYAASLIPAIPEAQRIWVQDFFQHHPEVTRNEIVRESIHSRLKNFTIQAVPRFIYWVGHPLEAHLEKPPAKRTIVRGKAHMKRDIKWGGGSGVTCALLARHQLQADKIEMYGFDFNGQKCPKEYLGQERCFEDWCSFEPNLFVNCCPSSLTDVFLKEERPWTSQSPSLAMDRL